MTAILISLLILSIFAAGGLYAWHDLERLIEEQLEEDRRERRLDALWADDPERGVAA
jgi:ABC-type microcin C transport system permease subunit YejB